MLTEFIKRIQLLNRQRLAVGAGLLALVVFAVTGLVHVSKAPQGNSELSSQSRKGQQRYTPTPSEWASLTIEPVTERQFRAEHVTEGKIAVDEDRSTPVFSPYAGRVTKLLARPGDQVKQGQPLAVLEAMKMEHTITSPRDGSIAEVLYAVGDQVPEGGELLRLEDA